MAGSFPQDYVETVRNAGDIVRLISDYVPLKPGGARMKGLCPFHEEKTPSFSVDPERQLFYCFGCQTGGDIFRFVMLYEKVGFPEAVEMLAKRWGVPEPATTRGEANRPVDRVVAMNEAAVAFYRTRLAGTEGRACRGYLERRGLGKETVERLLLGHAPDAWEALGSHLQSKRFDPKLILAGGLSLARKSGQGHYDRFRNRLIFPIRDVNGRTVAFGGRALGDEPPKYINSPETPAYKKGEHLYGLDQAKQAIRKEGFAIVVEGYMDLAAVAQAGFDNVVASLGTAFTASQARLLARYAERVVFSYDGDAAGTAATARSLDLLLTKGFDVRVVELPAGSDPDDFISREGAEAYGELLRDAPAYLEFLITREARARNLQKIEDKVAGVNAVLPHVARLASSIERGQWAARLAEAFSIEDDLVRQELSGAVRSARPSVRQRPRGPRPLREAEARLVSSLLESPDEQGRWAEELDPEELADSEVAGIVRKILELAGKGGTADYNTVIAALDDEAERDLLTRIAFRDEPDEGPSVEDCLWAFRHKRLAREGKQVARSIGNMQKSSGDVSDAEVDQELARLQELARRRDALHQSVGKEI